MLKITIVSPFTFGYIDLLAAKLEEDPLVELTFIQTEEMRFQYASPLQRIQNLYLKTFKGENLKKEFQSRKILKRFELLLPQDFILVIRPDKLEKQLLVDLKNHTKKLISYYFDSLTKFTDKIGLIPLFDEVYSYERADVEKYGLRFITNFIPYDNINCSPQASGVFNISSYDERFPYLEKFAAEFKKLNFPYNFIVRKEKPYVCENIKIINHYLKPGEVKNLIEGSKILLDIQKGDQKGLSFRVFEALGYEKKLITTNADIKNYDFYNEQNILVVNPNKIKIPAQFLTSPYDRVVPAIKDNYTLNSWIKMVFGVS